MAKKMTAAKIEQLAFEIRKFLLDWEMWVDVTIYFNGKAISTDDRNGHFGYNDPEKLFVLEDMDPKKYIEYAGGILSMSFEGDFYDVVNYYEVAPAMDQFVEILEKYGCYYELGNAWNLSVYQKD